MLSGDVGTFPFSEFFQWLDQSRKCGVLTVGPFWLRVADRKIVSAARPESSPLSSAANVNDPALWPEACLDRIHDLFAMPPSTTFFFTEPADEARASSPAGGDRTSEVPLAVGVIETLLESMRHLDEWPRLDAAYPSEAAVLRARRGTPRSPGLAAVHGAAQRNSTIAAARLGLGLSRPAIVRRVALLSAAGLLEVDGVTPGELDPITILLSQAQVLVHEEQFDEAGLVLRSLLAADVFHRRARMLLADAERKQLAALYEEIDPTAMLAITSSVDNHNNRRPSSVELELLSQVERKQGKLSVQGLVLMSTARELEILKSLRWLVRANIVELLEPPA